MIGSTFMNEPLAGPAVTESVYGRILLKFWSESYS